MSWGDGGSKNALIPEIARNMRKPPLPTEENLVQAPAEVINLITCTLYTPASLSVYVEKYSERNIEKKN